MLWVHQRQWVVENVIVTGVSGAGSFLKLLRRALDCLFPKNEFFA